MESLGFSNEEIDIEYEDPDLKEVFEEYEEKPEIKEEEEEEEEEKLGDFNPGFMENLGFSNEEIEAKYIETEEESKEIDTDIKNSGVDEIEMANFDADFLSNLGFTDNNLIPQEDNEE